MPLDHVTFPHLTKFSFRKSFKFSQLLEQKSDATRVVIVGRRSFLLRKNKDLEPCLNILNRIGSGKSDSSREGLLLQDTETTDQTGGRENQDTTSPDARQPGADGPERRKSPRVSLTPASPNVEQDLAAKADRRKSERRSMDSLRAEALQNLVPESEISRRNKMGYSIPRYGFLKPARLLLLAVALFSGGLAAYMVSQQNEPEIIEPIAQTVTEVIPEAKTQILVAVEPIGIGQKLSPTSIAWEDWPEGSLRDDYITIADTPEAITDMSGSLARFEIFPGEPIRNTKLASADQGYLSAVLESGMRGVSVMVAAESASGGFIVPNDHVDIVATRSTDISRESETILHNVRVLAINSRLGETGKTGAPADPENPREQMFANQAIATLELSPEQAEVIISASMGGKLSLVLLSMTDFSKAQKVEQRASNTAIRVTSPFWLN